MSLGAPRVAVLAPLLLMVHHLTSAGGPPSTPPPPSPPGSLPAGNFSSEKVLSRARRYVVFPRGSSLQLVYCLTVHGYVPLTSIFTIGLTMGIAWKMPSEPRQLYLQRRDTSRHPDRVHRLKLFKDMEIFLNTRGLHGQQCVLRTICEATRTRVRKGSFMEELINVFFTLPSSSVSRLTDWDSARYNGTSCTARFPRCPPLLDIPIQPARNKRLN